MAKATPVYIYVISDTKFKIGSLILAGFKHRIALLVTKNKGLVMLMLGPELTV